MKKVLICAVLLAVCILGGCKDGTEPGSTENDAVTTAPVSGSETSPAGTAPAGTLPALSADGVLECQKSGDTLTVTVTLPECAGQEVSLLTLSDPQYQYTWSENPDALSDIGQITLDGQGKGSLTLKLKSESDPVYVILTAADGSYTAEVN